ncbi:MAG: hypothetical protein ACOCZC_01935 [Halodesulfurarchaeum sp.]
MNRRLAGTVLVGIGVGLLVLVVALSPAELDVLLVETVPFGLVAAAVAFVGAWLLRASEPLGDHADHVLSWTLGGAASFGAVGQLLLLGVADGRILFPRLLVNAIAAGALAGALVGFYDARSRHRFEALQDERDRVARFARKAKSLNAYGKTLNQSRDLYDVSALSVEVLELLIESSGSAVVVVAEADTAVLDSTMPASVRSFLRRFAEQSAEGEPMETVRCPAAIDCQMPTEMDATEMLAVPVPSGDGTVVLMAATPSADAYTAEDLDLLESLSAHVGTALSDLEVGVGTVIEDSAGEPDGDVGGGN